MTDKHLELLAYFWKQRKLTQADIHVLFGIRKFYCEKRKLNNLHYKTLRHIATKRKLPIWTSNGFDYSVLEPEVKVVEKIVEVPKKTTTRKKTTTKKENDNVVSSTQNSKTPRKTRTKKEEG